MAKPGTTDAINNQKEGLRLMVTLIDLSLKKLLMVTKLANLAMMSIEHY